MKLAVLLLVFGQTPLELREQARQLILEERFPAAAPLLERALAAEPNELGHYLALGFVYTEMGQGVKAVSVLERGRALNAQAEPVHTGLGRAYGLVGRFAEAAAAYRESLRLKPGQQDTILALGRTLVAAKDYESGLAVLRQYRGPESLEPAYLKGLALRGLERYAEAETELRKAVLVGPRHADAHYQLGFVLLRQGKAAEARGVLEKSRDLNPVAETRFQLAQAYRQLGEPEKAAAELRVVQESRRQATDTAAGVTQYQLALARLRSGDRTGAENAFKQAGDIAEARIDYGVLLGQMNRFVEAEQQFRRATELDPKSGLAWLNLGLMRASQGRFRDAQKDLVEANRLMPRQARVLSAMAMVAGRLNQWKEAVALFARVVEIEPGSAEAHLNLGIARADQYDLEGARAAFDQAVALAPASSAARYNLGRVLFDQKQFEAAMPHLEASVKADEKLAHGWYLLAASHRNLEQPEKGLAIAEQLLRREPMHQEGLFLKGQICVQLGRVAEAIAAWEKLLTVRADHHEALYALSRQLQKVDAKRASEYRARLAGLTASRQVAEQAESLGNFGLSAAAVNDWPRAVERLREAIELCGECRAQADLEKNLGLVLARSGDLTQAEVMLRKSRERKPGDIEIVRALEMLRMRQK
ncbi:MAG: tetratricopeptide repeat protein [Acidobacteria bacterium]|nr:tetratricopeptide repeat protein [Acidobacteriota bacterium]